MKEFVLSNRQGEVNLKIDYAKELNDEQLKVVQNGNGPTLVLAGAGSGKTRTITYRVAWLLEHNIPANAILLVTFTNKAAREMTERIQQLFGQYPDGLWSGTFHSIANRLLRTYAESLGYQPNFSILNQDDAQDLIGLCVKDLKISTKEKRFPGNKVLLSMISYARNKDVPISQVVELQHPKFMGIIDEIEKVKERYLSQKKEQNVMDFDDLLVHLRNLLRDNEDIRSRLAGQFQYVLVDEFQDTNAIQSEIVKYLASVHQNVLVVGDDAQSIYSFRAAEIRNILDFPNTYKQSQKFELIKNYRSTPEILQIANEVIRYNDDQFEKDLQANKASGEKPYIVPANNSAQEAQYIVDQIFELMDEGIKLSEMAILFRAAFHSQALEFELMRRDIPYDYRGGMKFFERSHVKDIIAHIRLLNNPSDGMAWVRALRIHPGIGLVTAGKIANLAREAGGAQALIFMENPAGKRAESGWRSFTRVLQAIVEKEELPGQIIRALVSTDEYQAYLENEFPNYKERLDDLEQFSMFAEQYNNIDQFLEAVSLTEEFGVTLGERPKDDENDKLILSTIHQAKGLEWNAVFVINCAEGAFPHSRSLQDDADLQEERRLFYVAVTRARDRLFLTYPITAGFDYVEIRQQSMFLDEIPSNMIEQIKLRQPNSSFEQNSWKKKKALGRTTNEVEDDFWSDEPTIVLDDYGEREKKNPPSSFLIDID